VQPVDLALERIRHIRLFLSQNHAQSLCNLSRYCSAMNRVDSNGAILHVEIQSYLFPKKPNPQQSNGFTTDLPKVCAYPTGTSTVLSQLRSRTFALTNLMSASVRLTMRDRNNDRPIEGFFKRFFPAGDHRHHERRDGSGGGVTAPPCQFGTC
jgi:hypothetical protein